MGEKMRKSGIDILGDVPWGTHFCQFYQTKEDLTDILVPYLKAGLEDNEFCLWVTSYPMEVEEAKEALKEAVSDIDVYLDKGQIEIIPYTDWYIKDGVLNSERVLNVWIEKLDQVLASGYEGLRIAGDASWLKKESWDDFVGYMGKMDAIIGKYRIMALNSYFIDKYSATEIIHVVSHHQFSLIKREGKWELIENSGWKNITGRKRADEALRQSEQSFRLNVENILSPAQELANLELAEIIDAQAIQSLMDDFYKLAHIPIGIIDLKGNVLVGVGWQDICTRFHRVHPEACKHCVESDTKLSTGVLPGEFKLYKCKNNMWDIATPIIVGGQHVGNIFLGQFFFEGEPLDYELFRSQARKYGFNEDEYIEALKKVPQLSKETVNAIMVFFMTLANIISQLGYSNLKLAQSLAEREALVDALRESEKRERARLDELAAVLDAVPVTVFIAHDPKALKITGNRLSYEWIHVPVGTNFSKSTPEEERPEMFKLFKDGVEIQPADMPSQMAAAGREINDLELDIISSDGEIRHVLGNARPLRDEQGNLRGSVSAFIDITERKKAEEALKKAHDNLEEKVKERTAELEKAYNSLKESERGLAEAQKMAHIGNWEWDLLTEKSYWSDELYRIVGLIPQELKSTYDAFLRYVHPEDRDYVNNAIKEAVNGKPYDIDYRIVSADGTERIVNAQGEVILNEENIPVQMRGTVQDITESKKAEEKIQILANAVESSSDSIVTGSLDDIIISWNKGAELIHGYSAEEILGKHVSILEPDSLKGEMKRFSEKIKKGKAIQNYETLMLKKDGTIINVSVTLSPVFDVSGELVAISTIARDITERKRAEETLRKSEARMRRFYESGMFGVFYYNLDGSITDANDRFLEIVGYTHEDLQVGRINWERMTPPEYRLLDENCIAELKTTGVNVPYEKEFIRKDGSRAPVILGAAIYYQAHNEGIAFVLDITEKKQREQKIRRYYNVLEGINRIFGSVIRAETEEELGNVCLSVALEVTGSQTGFVGEMGAGSILHGIAASNMEWAQYLTYDKTGNHRSLSDFVLYGMCGRIVDSGKSFFTNDPPSYPNSIGLPHSHLQFASFLGVPLLSEGKTIGLMAVANREGGYSYEQQEDLEAISPAVMQALQRKRAEKALEKMEIIRIKEIHHRIKNNLQVISSLLDLQAEKFQDKEVLEAFRESQSRVLSMSLIHEELYKGEGTDTLDFSTYLRKLAENLFQTYSLSSENIRLYMDLEENAFFNMDTAVPLGIIVNELVSNSFKHAFPEKEGEIRIRLCREEKNKEIDKSLFSLTISDNGKGIPENVELGSLESLGLQLVSILVDQLDGKIELKREQGTEFKIIFRVAEKS